MSAFLLAVASTFPSVAAAQPAGAIQGRVAWARGEVPTDGYVTLDLRGGLDVTANVSLQGGITNLLGTSYAEHLNAKNPFTSRQIYEPGRVFFVDLTVAF